MSEGSSRACHTRSRVKAVYPSSCPPLCLARTLAVRPPPQPATACSHPAPPTALTHSHPAPTRRCNASTPWTLGFARMDDSCTPRRGGGRPAAGRGIPGHARPRPCTSGGGDRRVAGVRLLRCSQSGRQGVDGGARVSTGQVGSLPVGGVDPSETLAEGVAREGWEETGHRFVAPDQPIVRYLGEARFYLDPAVEPAPSAYRHSLLFAVEGTAYPDSGWTGVPGETRRVAWLDPRELPLEAVHPRHCRARQLAGMLPAAEPPG